MQDEKQWMMECMMDSESKFSDSALSRDRKPAGSACMPKSGIIMAQEEMIATYEKLPRRSRACSLKCAFAVLLAAPFRCDGENVAGDCDLFWSNVAPPLA